MADVERELEFGLEQFASDRVVELPLRDALHAFKAIGQLIEFFHQPDNWRSLADVERFIGTVDEGALHVLHDAYYERLRDVWPADVQEAIDSGRLELRGSGPSRPG